MTDKVLFRASGIGNLMVEGRGLTLTDIQKKRLEELQSKDKITEKQQLEFEKLIAKRDAPPELSDTAKGYIHDIWLMNEKGFYEEISNRYTEKGLFNEVDGVELISEAEGRYYTTTGKNRETKGNITGECDVLTEIEGKKVIKDIKCSWSPKTFMNAKMTTLYEWQGRAYMHLYNADEFHLHYCLTDCPAHLYENEVWKLKNKFGIIDQDEETVKPLFDQLKLNHIFSDNPAYTKSERVKTFIITRDMDKENALLSKIPQAIEYYKSLKLNMNHETKIN